MAVVQKKTSAFLVKTNKLLACLILIGMLVLFGSSLMLDKSMNEMFVHVNQLGYSK